MNNEMQLINMLRSARTPKDAVINMMKSNNNPMVKNLVEMAEKGDNQGIEKFARNIFKEQGRDFDKEFGEFTKNFK